MTTLSYFCKDQSGTKSTVWGCSRLFDSWSIGCEKQKQKSKHGWDRCHQSKLPKPGMNSGSLRGFAAEAGGLELRQNITSLLMA